MEAEGASLYYGTGIGVLNVDLSGVVENYLQSPDFLETVEGLYTAVKTKGFNLWEKIMGGGKKKNKNMYPRCELTGLENLGNTCFMNSTIQTLFMCDKFRNEVLLNVPKEKQIVMAELRATFACLVESKGEKAYNPCRFLKVARPPWFEPKCQQDSSEFLRYLLNLLHEEEQECGSNDTIVERLFGGKLENSYTCKACQIPCSSDEVFFDITLTLPSDNYVSKLLLRDMYKKFLEEELIRGGYCNTCDCTQEIMKKTKILQYPKYFCFSLMRFTNYGIEKYHTKNLSPIDYPDSFPIESRLNYDLTGVIIHSGRTPQSGHYYSYSRGITKGHDNNQQWFLFNDSSVHLAYPDSLKETCSNTSTSGTSCVLVYSQVTGEEQTMQLDLPPDLKQIVASRSDEQKVEVYNRKTAKNPSSGSHNKTHSKNTEESEKHTGQKTKEKGNSKSSEKSARNDKGSPSHQIQQSHIETKAGEKNKKARKDSSGSDKKSQQSMDKHTEDKPEERRRSKPSEDSSTTNSYSSSHQNKKHTGHKTKEKENSKSSGKSTTNDNGSSSHQMQQSHIETKAGEKNKKPRKDSSESDKKSQQDHSGSAMPVKKTDVNDSGVKSTIETCRF